MQTHRETVARLLEKTADAVEQVAKAFGASADPMAGGQTVTVRPGGQSLPMTVRSHPDELHHEDHPLPDRHLACPACGHGMLVEDGVAELRRKRAQRP
ncbi:MAG TPA: hypothetical protein VHV75_14960 [Solirubrobacteraceae bacterium]|jgi:hypothetical protein|nr:hypothetical protein [Solirubrobacteraceae bacterium]